MAKLKQLRTQHREIARLSFQGFSPQEIADRTGMKVGSIYAILKNPMCQAYINGLHDKADDEVINVRKKLFDLSAPAVRRMDDILSDESKAPFSVVAAVAKDVLDRTGHKAPEQHQHLVAHMTTEDILELARRRAEKVIN